MDYNSRFGRIMEGYHKPVLLREVIDTLKVQVGSWYLDCTLGDGGHALAIIKSGGNIVGLDVDPEAIKRARKRLHLTADREQQFILVKGNFRDIKNLLEKQTELKDQKFAGAIFDLGVSSLQLMSPERGFSFSWNGPLDMRMDPELKVRALDLINVLTRKELYELFSSLGEEKYSKRLADTLVSAREVRGDRLQSVGISNTTELAAVIEKVVGGRKGRIHPATRVFQALRIAVNDELGALTEGLEAVKDLIEKNGHIIIISFHSLEDRIAKNTFREWQKRGLGEILTRKPVIPSDQEILTNPRSRSAKMRVFMKT